MTFAVKFEAALEGSRVDNRALREDDRALAGVDRNRLAFERRVEDDLLEDDVLIDGDEGGNRNGFVDFSAVFIKRLAVETGRLVVDNAVDYQSVVLTDFGNDRRFAVDGGGVEDVPFFEVVVDNVLFFVDDGRADVGAQVEGDVGDF